VYSYNINIDLSEYFFKKLDGIGSNYKVLIKHNACNVFNSNQIIKYIIAKIVYKYYF
jgi:hypothetical protein